MARDANGNYSLPPGTIVATGDTILPSQHNPAMNDIATSMSNSLSRDGQGGMRADLNLGGFSIVNIVALSASSLTAASGANGRASLTSPSASNTGQIEFQNGSGTRQGYIGAQTLGSSTGPIGYHNDAGSGHFFDGGPLAVDGTISTSGRSNSIGTINFSQGTSSSVGAVEMRNASGIRQSIIGAQALTGGVGGAVQYHNDAGTGHKLDGGPTSVESLQIGADWTLTEESGSLVLRYQGTAKHVFFTNGDEHLAGNIQGNGI